MKKLKEICNKFRHLRALKYVLVSVIAIVVIGFVDENSVWHHYQNQQKIDELQEEIRKYRGVHQHNKDQIKVLDSNPKAIEKIARERYFMKEDGEDIFVLSDDNEEMVIDETVE